MIAPLERFTRVRGETVWKVRIGTEPVPYQAHETAR